MTTLLTYAVDDHGYPAETEAGVRCGNHWRELRIRHTNADAVRACYAIARDEAAQQAAEIWAENAWLRHAEGWYRLPDRDEELEAMAASSGLPVPPGMV